MRGQVCVGVTHTRSHIIVCVFGPSIIQWLEGFCFQCYLMIIWGLGCLFQEKRKAAFSQDTIYIFAQYSHSITQYCKADGNIFLFKDTH